MKTSSIPPYIRAESGFSLLEPATTPSRPTHGQVSVLNQCSRWITLNANGSP